MCPTARNFFARQGDLTRQYFVYCKENQRSMAGKEPPFGYIDIFQTWPRKLMRSIQIFHMGLSPMSHCPWRSPRGRRRHPSLWRINRKCGESLLSPHSLSKNLCLDESARVLAGGIAARLEWDQMPREVCCARLPAGEARTFAPLCGAKVTAFYTLFNSRFPGVYAGTVHCMLNLLRGISYGLPRLRGAPASWAWADSQTI